MPKKLKIKEILGYHDYGDCVFLNRNHQGKEFENKIFEKLIVSYGEIIPGHGEQRVLLRDDRFLNHFSVSFSNFLDLLKDSECINGVLTGEFIYLLEQGRDSYSDEVYPISIHSDKYKNAIEPSLEFDYLYTIEGKKYVYLGERLISDDNFIFNRKMKHVFYDKDKKEFAFFNKVDFVPLNKKIDNVIHSEMISEFRKLDHSVKTKNYFYIDKYEFCFINMDYTVYTSKKYEGNSVEIVDEFGIIRYLTTLIPDNVKDFISDSFSIEYIKDGKMIKERKETKDFVKECKPYIYVKEKKLYKILGK